MSNIKNNKEALDLLTYENNFGLADFNGLTQEELVQTIGDKHTREALRERGIQARKDGRGAKRKPDSDQYITMSFKVNIEQLEKIREIGYRESRFTKEVLFEALGDYIDKYERVKGEVIPQGKSIVK